MKDAHVFSGTRESGYTNNKSRQQTVRSRTSADPTRRGQRILQGYYSKKDIEDLASATPEQRARIEQEIDTTKGELAILIGERKAAVCNFDPRFAISGQEGGYDTPYWEQQPPTIINISHRWYSAHDYHDLLAQVPDDQLEDYLKWHMGFVLQLAYLDGRRKWTPKSDLVERIGKKRYDLLIGPILKQRGKSAMVVRLSAYGQDFEITPGHWGFTHWYSI